MAKHINSTVFYTVTLTIWGGCNPLNPPLNPPMVVHLLLIVMCQLTYQSPLGRNDLTQKINTNLFRIMILNSVHSDSVRYNKGFLEHIPRILHDYCILLYWTLTSNKHGNAWVATQLIFSPINCWSRVLNIHISHVCHMIPISTVLYVEC